MTVGGPMVMHRLTALVIVTLSSTVLRFGLVPTVDRIISPTGDGFVIMAAEAETLHTPIPLGPVPRD